MHSRPTSSMLKVADEHVGPTVRVTSELFNYQRPIRMKHRALMSSVRPPMPSLRCGRSAPRGRSARPRRRPGCDRGRGRRQPYPGEHKPLRLFDPRHVEAWLGRGRSWPCFAPDRDCFQRPAQRSKRDLEATQYCSTRPAPAWPAAATQTGRGGDQPASSQFACVAC